MTYAGRQWAEFWAFIFSAAVLIATLLTFATGLVRQNWTDVYAGLVLGAMLGLFWLGAAYGREVKS